MKKLIHFSKVFFPAIIVLPFCVVVMTTCVLLPGEKEQSVEKLIREGGHSEISEGQGAVFMRAPHPGMVLFRDDFTQKQRMHRNYIRREKTEKGINDYCRLSPSGWEQITLLESHRLTHFRVSLDIRFQPDDEGTVEINGRAMDDQRSSVKLTLTPAGWDLREEQRGEALQTDRGNVPFSGEDWKRVDFELLGARARVSVDGEEVFTRDDLSLNQPGRILLAYEGQADLDNIKLVSLERGDGSSEEALLMESFQDDFTGKALLPWWIEEGEENQISLASDGGVIVGGSREHRSTAGIRNRALFPGEGVVNVEADAPGDNNALIIALGKPSLDTSLQLMLYDDHLVLKKLYQKEGVIITQMPLPEELTRASQRSSVRIEIKNSALHVFINDVCIGKSRPLGLPGETFRGNLFLGYGGYLETGTERRIYQVSVSDELPEDFESSDYKLFPEGDEERGERRAYIFPAPDDAVIEDFNSPRVSHFNNIGTNTGSSAEREIIYDPETGEGYLAFHVTMKEENGLHALISQGLRSDLSGYGGITFRARAEGMERAHLSMAEDQPGEVNDRIDFFFSVGNEWRDYRLPFSRENYTLFHDHILQGSDGNFDFERVDWAMFEIWGYEGAGSLFLDDIRLLPKGAERGLTGKSVVEDFEKEDPFASPLPYRQINQEGGSQGTFKRLEGEGAGGSRHFGRLEGQKREWGELSYRMEGTLSGEGFDGFGFSLRSEDVSAFTVVLGELEPKSALMGRLSEDFYAHLPVNDRWVDWRFLFEGRGLAQARYHPFMNGRLDGGIIGGIGFLFPDGMEQDSVQADFDHVFLFEEEEPDDISVGIFRPEGGDVPDEMIADVILSVFDLNLQRVGNYRVEAGLEASDREDAYGAARRAEVDFFLWPEYRKEGRGLSLTFTVCGTASHRVEKEMTAQTVAGMDIFADLDELSEEAVNVLADTNLSFRDKLESQAGGDMVWRDSLSEDASYWMAFDGASSAFSGEGLRLEPAVSLEDASSHPSFLKQGMVLAEPYFKGISEISVDVLQNGGPALFLWNYQARGAFNALRLEGETLEVWIKGKKTEFRLPERFHPRFTADDQTVWLPLRLRRSDAAEDASVMSYEIAAGDEPLGTASGPDFPFGRVGMGAETVPAVFRNVRVVFAE